MADCRHPKRSQSLVTLGLATNDTQISLVSCDCPINNSLYLLVQTSTRITVIKIVHFA
jgi:hypothetical protein